MSNLDKQLDKVLDKAFKGIFVDAWKTEEGIMLDAKYREQIKARHMNTCKVITIENMEGIAVTKHNIIKRHITMLVLKLAISPLLISIPAMLTTVPTLLISCLPCNVLAENKRHIGKSWAAAMLCTFNTICNTICLKNTIS